MDLSEKFDAIIPECLEQLEVNEWTLTEARESLVAELESAEAFDSITNVLLLATKQNDSYAFLSCCWLCMQLVKLSNTTEMPTGLDLAINKAYDYAHEVDSNLVADVKVIADWYRL